MFLGRPDKKNLITKTVNKCLREKVIIEGCRGKNWYAIKKFLTEIYEVGFLQFQQ
jgi:hypothetical protein